VILDIDGTLLASNDAHAFAFKEAAATLGVEADLNQIRRLIVKAVTSSFRKLSGLKPRANRAKSWTI
jgi:beta-phosphoglucomutase-like phosphatase (HAD superfamily)